MTKWVRGRWRDGLSSKAAFLLLKFTILMDILVQKLLIFNIQILVFNISS